jgi:NTE family protein
LRVLRKLPPELESDADVRRLKEVCECRKITIAHLINRRYAHSAHSKDFEFSRATTQELWASGVDDVRRTCAHPELLKGTEFAAGVRVYDLTR